MRRRFMRTERLKSFGIEISVIENQGLLYYLIK